MRRLAPDHTITQIIDCLHEAGFKPARGYEKFTPNSVRVALKNNGIDFGCTEHPRSDESRGDGRYPALVVARMLNVSSNTIYRWCRTGVLDGIRKMPRGAYWVKITPEQVTALKKPYSRKFTRRKVA
jgi:hypothetical protein